MSTDSHSHEEVFIVPSPYELVNKRRAVYYVDGEWHLHRLDVTARSRLVNALTSNLLFVFSF